MAASYADIKVRAEATKLLVEAFGVFPSLAHKYLRAFSQTQEQSVYGGKAYISLEAWLSTFDKVLADIGPNALFQVGQRVVTNPHFSEGARGLEDALRQVDVAYHMSHRRDGVAMYNPTTGRMLEGIGHYVVQVRPDEKAIALTSDTPYPCPLEHGIVSSIAFRFEPRSIVTHEAPAQCRLKGGTRCTFLVSW